MLTFLHTDRTFFIDKKLDCIDVQLHDSVDLDSIKCPVFVQRKNLIFLTFKVRKSMTHRQTVQTENMLSISWEREDI
jgi:hypothetical protein